MKIELTEADRALDVETLYKETTEAIRALRGILRQEPPAEAEMMLSLIKRCLVAEETISAIAKRTEAWSKVEGQHGEAESALRSCFAWSHGGSIEEYLK